MTERPLPRLGKLPPRYIFILNPYTEARFSRCPICEQKMHQRKVPLFIHVDPSNPVVLGYTCRYCPHCDLLIAHQDQIEGLLARIFGEHDPSLIGNDYLVLGTVEMTAWRESMKQPKGLHDMLEYLHDFQEVRTIEYQPAGWYPETPREPDDQVQPDEPATRPEPASRPGGERKRPNKSKRKRSKRR
jgi:hypothetical protein